MTLVLNTPSDPGSAVWTPASLVDQTVLLLVVELAVAGAVPTIDPAGRRNLLYMCNFVAGVANVELPEITPTLPPTWRVTLGGADTSNSLVIAPAAGNVILNQTGAIGAEFIETTPGLFQPQSVTFIHDGTTGWSVFYGGLR